MTPPAGGIIRAVRLRNLMTQAVDPAGVTRTRGPLVAGECVATGYAWIGMQLVERRRQRQLAAGEFAFSPLQNSLPVTVSFYTRRDHLHYLLQTRYGLRQLFLLRRIINHWMASGSTPTARAGADRAQYPTQHRAAHHAGGASKIAPGSAGVYQKQIAGALSQRIASAQKTIVTSKQAAEVESGRFGFHRPTRWTSPPTSEATIARSHRLLPGFIQAAFQ